MEGIRTKAKIVILYSSVYDMLTEEKDKIKGCSVHYMFWGEYGERMMHQTEWNSEKSVGIQRAKCSIDYDLRPKIPVAPALYEGEFEMTVGGDGKPVLRLRDVSYICNIDIRAKVVEGLVVPGMVSPEERAVLLSEELASAPKDASKGVNSDNNKK